MKRVYLGFRTRLIIFYFLFALVPISILSLFSYYIYSKDIQRMEDTLLHYSSYQTVINLDRKIVQCKEQVAKILFEPQVVKYAERFYKPVGGEESLALIRNKLVEKFTEFASANQYITGIVFISNNNDTVMLDRVKGDFQGRVSPEFKSYLLQYNKARYLDKIRIVPAESIRKGQSDNGYFYMVYPMADAVNKTISGVLAVEFNNEVLNSIILPDAKVLDERISAFSNISNEEGMIICSPDSSYLGKMIQDLPVYKKDYSVQSLDIGRSGLDFNLVFFRGPQQQSISEFQSFLWIMMIAILIVFSFGIKFLTKKLYEHSETIVTAINSFRENQTINPLSIDKDDEVMFAISDQFNKMSKDLSSLVMELKQKNITIKKVSDQRRKAEIKAIEAQINPHFIYNALDRINWIAIDNEQYEISEMLNDLGSILRYSINNVDVLVTFRAELEWMKKYINIQSERFGMHIEFKAEIGEGCIDFPIYKMLLQPLIENSVLRAFNKDAERPQIKICTQLLNEERMEIQVEDNGIGIKAEQLLKINEIIKGRGEKPGSGIGINNVVSRLYLYYGTQAEICVKSSVGRGTVFRIVVPRRSD